MKQMHHFDCIKCNKKMIRKDFYLSTVFYCEYCSDYKITERVCDHEFISIFFELANGTEQFREYCKKCYHRGSESLSQKDINPDAYLHKKEESYQKKMSELRKSEEIELRPFISKLRDKQQELYYSVYYNYINSKEWKKKSGSIMSRDERTCQICGKRANDVHHLTYAHFMNEYDFELISLCRDCHYNHYHSPEVKQKILKLDVPNIKTPNENI